MIFMRCTVMENLYGKTCGGQKKKKKIKKILLHTFHRTRDVTRLSLLFPGGGPSGFVVPGTFSLGLPRTHPVHSAKLYNFFAIHVKLKPPCKRLPILYHVTGNMDNLGNLQNIYPYYRPFLDNINKTYYFTYNIGIYKMTM